MSKDYSQRKVGDFAVFQKEFREGNQPHFTGKCNINGEEKRMAMWLAKTKEGKKYFYGQIENFVEQYEDLNLEDLEDE